MNRLHLFFIKIIFGKYSYDFQNQYSNQIFLPKNKKKYLQSCSKLNALSHLSSAFEDNGSDVRVSTGTIVTFPKIKPYGNFWKFLRHHRNYVGYDISKFGSMYWRRIAYREKIFNTKVKTIYHFLNDSFFFGEYFFSDARFVDVDGIKSNLCNNYGITHEIAGEKFKIYTKEAFIFFDYNGINLSIKFVFTTDEPINFFLNNLTKKTGLSPKQDSQKASLEFL